MGAGERPAKSIGAPPNRLPGPCRRGIFLDLAAAESAGTIGARSEPLLFALAVGHIGGGAAGIAQHHHSPDPA
jgi:hypothetical protein